MTCRTIAESILHRPPQEGLPASSHDLKSIAISVNTFIEQISNVKAVEKAQTAIRLNTDGTSKVDYNLGDQVSFFLPSSEEIDRARRLLEAYDDAKAQGVASVAFEGQMVDEPVARQARRVLAQADD